MYFTLNRDLNLASLTGHAVAFVKDQSTYVVPEMHNEVLALGAIPDEPLPEPSAAASNEPKTPAARYEALVAAFELLTLRNTREDFTAGGVPQLRPLCDVLGWTVGGKERDAAFAKMRAASGE